MTATEDYQAFLREHGLTEASMQEALRGVMLKPTPFDHRTFLAASKIRGAGFGMFANGPMEAGEWIAPILVRGMWTRCGRYTNHSNTPNTVAIREEDGVALQARRKIEFGEEITANYRQVKSVMESDV